MKREKGQGVMQFIIPLGFFVLIVYVAFALLSPIFSNEFASALNGLASMDASSGMRVTQSPHAKMSHPEESAAIQECLNTKGAYQTWRDKYEKGKFYLLCQIADGRWGIEPVVVSGGALIAKTAFVPRDGSMNEVVRYLQQSASRYLLPIK